MNSNETFSLLPYLDCQVSPIYLEFSSDTLTDKNNKYFFVPVNDSDPLVKLIKGHIIVDELTSFKDLFFLIQKDTYLITNHELWPLNNLDIEKFWQKALTFYSQAEHNSFFVFSKQLDDQGQLIPCTSLFYCKVQRTFFHPPCPLCGCLLEQCYDDKILINSGLQPYTTSLQRYLYCPSCFNSGRKSFFYVYESGKSDSLIVRDCTMLFRDFAHLFNNLEVNSKFICTHCSEAQTCYNSGSQMTLPIVPFSFYPFYMLTFEAQSINALDFLSLVSGASFEEIENTLYRKSGERTHDELTMEDKQNPVTFFAHNDERYFLEVLYLKLTFLADIIKTLFEGLKVYKYPEIDFSLKRIWVKISEERGLLPSLWNFKVKLFTIGLRPHDTSLYPEMPLVQSLYHLGLIWFYTLLINKKQKITDVYPILKKVFDACKNSGNELTTEHDFSPEDIFWSPDEQVVSKRWHHYWDEAVNIGWSLIKIRYYGEISWSEDDFRNKLDSLREQIKIDLFQSGDGTVKRGVELYGQEEQAIYDILMNISQTWRKELYASEVPEIEEVRIIPQSEITEEVSLQQREKSEPVTPDALLKKTRIHKTHGREGIAEGEEKIEEPLKEQKEPDELLKETRIYKIQDREAITEGGEKIEEPFKEQKTPDELLKKTRIHKTQGREAITESEEKPFKEQKEPDNLLKETFIQRPQRDKRRQR